MKILIPTQARRGFTLPEIMTALAIFFLLVTATVSAQIFGLRMYHISEAKLKSTGSARTALNRVENEVRSASLLYIGNANGSSFTIISNGQACAGNALKICPTANTSNYVYYYIDNASGCLMRKSSSVGKLEIVSRYVTNTIAFRAEDFQGNTMTNNSNNRIIQMNLDFYNVEYPMATGANGKMADTFRLQTRFARRAL